MANRSRRRLNAAGAVAALFGLVVVCALLAAWIVPFVVGQGDLARGGEPTLAPDALAGQGGYESDLRTRVAATPTDAVAQISLARLLTLRGSPRDAFDHYERAIALDPENTTYRVDFGQALTDAGNFPDAEVQYRKALDVDPGDVGAHYWLGELYRRSQPPRTAEALEEYRRAVAGSPESATGKLAEEAIRQLTGSGTPVVTVPSPAR